MSNKKGFTLIELLVVISIIGLLSSVVLASLDSAREKARDAKRMQDINAIKTALELHFNDHRSYTQPESMCADTSYGSLGSCGGAGGTGDWDKNSDLRDLEKNGYISKLPVDPLNNSSYYYSYEPLNSNEHPSGKPGQAYKLCAKLEKGGTFCSNIK